jgi:hypothetical protein
MVTNDDRIIEGCVTIHPGEYFSFTWNYNTYLALSISSNGTMFARKIDRPGFVTSFSATQMQDAVPVEHDAPEESL